MKIFIDADASPVQKETVAIAASYNLAVVLIKSIDHFSHDKEAAHVDTIYVDKGADMADFEIVKRVKKNDIVITQDYGLAALCLGKHCHILHHKGFQYTERNIDRLLQSRHASALARRAGQRTKGPKPFTKADREKFAQLLTQVIEKYQNLS